MVYSSGSALKNASTRLAADSSSLVVLMPHAFLLCGFENVALPKSWLAALRFDCVTNADAARQQEHAGWYVDDRSADSRLGNSRRTIA